MSENRHFAIRTTVLFLAASWAVFPNKFADAHPTVEQLRRELGVESAHAVVATLWPNEWEWVADRMSDAKPDWIALMPRLEPGTDAWTSEDLGISAAFALPKAPAAVLSIINPQPNKPLSVERVCGAPFIEDTVKDIPAYLRRAKVAVDSVSRPDLESRKQACLAELTKVKIE